MKVYIASKYIEHKEINREIYSILKSSGLTAFLPESIDIDAINYDEMLEVSEICYNEIDKCDILLVVAPFGKSVSSEIGYAIGLKRKRKNLKIILLNIGNYDDVLQTEAMIAPYVDMEINCIADLTEKLHGLKS